MRYGRFVGALLVLALASCGGNGNGRDAGGGDDLAAPDDVPIVPDPGKDDGPDDPGPADDGIVAPDDAVPADDGADDGAEGTADADAGPDVPEVDVPCVPDCEGRACGSDGCGDVCGYCQQGFLCTTEGECTEFCRAQCEGKACGPDGCNGFCPPGCSDNEECSASFTCVLKSCVPQCEGKVCGPNGCGEDCGKCGDGFLCTPQGACTLDTNCYEVTAAGRCVGSERQWCEANVLQKEACDTAGGFVCGYDNLAKKFVCRKPEVCQPQCTGKQCGPDGCPGGSCGTCAADQVCSTGGQCGEPCEDVTPQGICIDEYQLAFCHQGILLRYDCFAANPPKPCQWNPEQQAFDCYNP